MTENNNKPSVVIVGKVLPILHEQLQSYTTITHLENISGDNAKLLDNALLTADGLISTSMLKVNETLLNKAPH